jgi:hypothetical protein
MLFACWNRPRHTQALGFKKFEDNPSVLSRINGMIWILQLYRLGLCHSNGTGVVLAVTGLVSCGYERGKSISNWVMLTTMIVAAVEFVLLIFIA